ncbi:cilia- and flagella-associated protein 61-like isoform X3 [Physella acuta]|nr:cilia- and flagella-associated protein 61-like isoform X3 [Physella acuta]
MQCLVAEVEKTSYGFMSISTDVNLDLLNECFELIPFNGLRKPHPDDIIQPTDSASLSLLSDKEEDTVASETEGTKVDDAVPESSCKRDSRVNSSLTTPTRKDLRLSDAGSTGLFDVTSTTLNEDTKLDDEIHKINANYHLKTPPTLMPPPIKRFVPTYYGLPNAFSIQLFCIAEQYEMRSFDFLPKAFSKFPDRDFCIITVPHMVPEFPLIQNFVRVTPKCPSILPQELYVFHRSGLLKNFKVRQAVSGDYEAVEKLVATIDGKEKIMADLKQFNTARRDNDGTEIQSYVGECLGQIVGVAIMRREEDIEFIRSHYNIEDFIYFNHHSREEHGHLHHFVLNPVFSHFTKHFFKEILRLSKKTSLYYPLYPPYSTDTAVGKHSLITGLSSLVPVRARRQIEYPEGLGINGPSERVKKKVLPFALNHINRKLVLEPKVTINARIVVIGASDVGLTFLETLVFCPHLKFNNITLISPHGIPGDMTPNEMRDSVLGESYCFTKDDFAKMALRTWVNVVYGKMSGINRTKKQVIVNGVDIVPFDHLIICTGLQYQVPSPTGVTEGQLLPLETLAQLANRRYTGQVPPNLYLINDTFDAAVALYRVEHNLQNKSIVVYGNSIDSYTFIQTLLKSGIKGENLILVEPPAIDGVSPFNNPEIEDELVRCLEESGVTVCFDCFLANWNNGEGGAGHEIKSISISNATDFQSFSCDALFCFFKKDVNLFSFKAMNSECLVYDGKLVINATFHTNDVSIRAAGPLTKFSRKYHCEAWTHANFNSREIGIALASEMLRLFDPTLEPCTEPPEEPLNLIPMYRNPKVVSAYLPGDYHYFHVYKPCVPTTLQQMMAKPDYGQVLVTGKLGSEQDYMRLHFNQYNTVETITCMSRKPFPKDNFLCLYGVHERMLNNLFVRYKEGLITDFYKYLMEPWAMAIYHDRFPDLRDEIRELLISNEDEKAATIEDLARQLVDEEIGFTQDQRKELMSAYIATGAKRAVETRLLNFIGYNHYHLPMYAKPGMV